MCISRSATWQLCKIISKLQTVGVSVTRDRIQNAATFQYQSKLDGLRLYLKDHSIFYPPPFSRDIHLISICKKIVNMKTLMHESWLENIPSKMILF